MAPGRKLRLSEEQRNELEAFIRNAPSERLRLRASMVLDCGTGMTGAAVAAKYEERPSTVSLWKNRYRESGLSGLRSLSRGRTKDVYGADFPERLQAALGGPPPDGCPAWDVALLSEHLGVPRYGVRRYLNRLGIVLETKPSAGGRQKQASPADSAPAREAGEGGPQTGDREEPVVPGVRENAAEGLDVSLTVAVTNRAGGTVLTRTVDLSGILADPEHFDIRTVAGYRRDYGKLERGMRNAFADLLEQLMEDYTAMVRKKRP